MAIKLIKNVDDIKINFEKFPNECNMLLVTGLSGSGKSWLSKHLAAQYDAKIFQPEWLIHSKHTSPECKHLLDDFLKTHFEIVPYVENKWNDVKCEDKHEVLKKYINLFFEYFLKNCDKQQIYIIEGLQIFTLIDFDTIKDFPMIIIGTSSFNSLKNRLKRDLPKHTNKMQYFFKIIKQSKLYQFKHRKKLNMFLAKLQSQ